MMVDFLRRFKNSIKTSIFSSQELAVRDTRGETCLFRCDVPMKKQALIYFNKSIRPEMQKREW